MSLLTDLTKQSGLKVEQVKQFATHLKIDLEKAGDTQKQGIEEAIALFKEGIPIEEACQQVRSKAKEAQAKPETPALITKLAEIHKLQVEQVGQFAQHLKVDAEKATDSQVQLIEGAIALFKEGTPIEESCQQVTAKETQVKAKETQAKSTEPQTKPKETQAKAKAKETQAKAKETQAKAKAKKVSNSDKGGGAIVPQTSEIDRESIPEMGEDHQSFMETIDGVTGDAAKDKGPDLRGAIAIEINETGDNLINAARNYAGYSMNQALAKEMNSPEFLEQLRKEIKAGKSQTSANN